MTRAQEQPEVAVGVNRKSAIGVGAVVAAGVETVATGADAAVAEGVSVEKAVGMGVTPAWWGSQPKSDMAARILMSFINTSMRMSDRDVIKHLPLSTRHATLFSRIKVVFVRDELWHTGITVVFFPRAWLPDRSASTKAEFLVFGDLKRKREGKT